MVHSRPSPRRTAPTRRGSIYVLALGASTLVVIAGLSVIAITRAQGRSADAERDSSEASLAARSGVEIAAASVNTITAWRTSMRNNAPIGPLTIGRAQVTLFLTDESDADLANDPSQPVRTTAVARVGTSTRALSARLIPVGNLGLDCLRASVVAGGTLSVTGSTSISAGLLMCGTTLSNAAQLTADIEAKSVTSTGFINGRVTTDVQAQTLPTDSVWDTYAARATVISYTNSSETIDRKLLSPASNPFGIANPAGIYRIDVPANKTLVLSRSRLQATLLVKLGAKATIALNEEVNWEPPSATQPILIIAGNMNSGVTLNLSAAALSESGHSINLNPPGSPYAGLSNTTSTDTYPSQLRGLIHVVGSSTSVSLQGSTRLTGCLIAAGDVSVSGTPTMATLPALLTTPPVGYTKATGIIMQIEPGSYQWVVDLAQTR